MNKKSFIFIVACCLSLETALFCGSAGMKAVKAFFLQQRTVLELMRLGNAFAKAAGEVSPEEYSEVTKAMNRSFLNLRKQRSEALDLQKKIDVAEKFLVAKASVLSCPFPCNESRKVREELEKDRSRLQELMLAKKNARKE